MFAGAPLGGFLASAAGPALLQAHSWHAIFLVGGVFPIAASGLLVLKLPESLRFLVVTGRTPQVAQELLKRLAPDRQLSSACELVVNEPARSRTAVGELFGDGRAAATLLLWVVFVATQFMVFLYTSWLPTLLKEAGVALSMALYVTAVFQIGAVAGAVAAGWASDRTRSDRVLALMFGAAVIGAATLANTASLPVMFLSAALLGIGAPGAQVCLNAFAALLYPTHMRATGVGWALGIGRLGSIASPLLVGMALNSGWGPRQVVLGTLVPALICLGGILLAAPKLGRQPPSGGDRIELAH
jgi:AAHS family 4-hydroxybenzoate transporter-like MFS transporter